MGRVSETGGSQDEACLGVYGKFKAGLVGFILETLSQKKNQNKKTKEKKDCMWYSSVVEYLPGE